MVKIRLTRLGDKGSPFYRIIVADSRASRDGKFIDIVGTYDPTNNPVNIKVDNTKAKNWLDKGALPTDTVKAILQKCGVIKASEKPVPAKTKVWKKKKESN